MMLKFIFIVSIIFASAESCTYRGMECPKYTLVEKHLDYEVRSYPILTWAITTEFNRLGKAAERKASRRLTEYFEGKNNKSMEIPKTLPVRIKINHFNKNNYEVSFLIPSDWAKNPPCPIDMLIRIVQEPATLYVVRSFSGYYSELVGVPDKTWDLHAKKLASVMKDDDSVRKSAYYKMLYDIPSLFTECHNEIWMIKEVE